MDSTSLPENRSQSSWWNSPAVHLVETGDFDKLSRDSAADVHRSAQGRTTSFAHCRDPGALSRGGTRCSSWISRRPRSKPAYGGIQRQRLTRTKRCASAGRQPLHPDIGGQLCMRICPASEGRQRPCPVHRQRHADRPPRTGVEHGSIGAFNVLGSAGYHGPIYRVSAFGSWCSFAMLPTSGACRPGRAWPPLTLPNTLCVMGMPIRPSALRCLRRRTSSSSS